MHYSKARLGLSMPLIRGVFWAMALTPASLFVSKTCFLCLCATGKARRVSFLVSHPGNWQSQSFPRAAPICQQQISPILQKCCFQLSPRHMFTPSTCFSLGKGNLRSLIIQCADTSSGDAGDAPGL